jgi:hypothetical protein
VGTAKQQLNPPAFRQKSSGRESREKAAATKANAKKGPSSRQGRVLRMTERREGSKGRSEERFFDCVAGRPAGAGRAKASSPYAQNDDERG